MVWVRMAWMGQGKSHPLLQMVPVAAERMVDRHVRPHNTLAGNALYGIWIRALLEVVTCRDTDTDTCII